MQLPFLKFAFGSSNFCMCASSNARVFTEYGAPNGSSLQAIFTSEPILLTSCQMRCTWFNFIYE